MSLPTCHRRLRLRKQLCLHWHWHWTGGRQQQPLQGIQRCWCHCRCHLPQSSSPLVVVVHPRVLSSSAALPPQDHCHRFCLTVEGSSASRSPLLCPGWLSRRILSLHLRLCLSFLRRTASFFCPLAVQPLPLIVSRRRWLSRLCCLLSAGAILPICLSHPGWLSRRISLRRHRRLLSS